MQVRTLLKTIYLCSVVTLTAKCAESWSHLHFKQVLFIQLCACKLIMVIFRTAKSVGLLLAVGDSICFAKGPPVKIYYLKLLYIKDILYKGHLLINGHVWIHQNIYFYWNSPLFKGLHFFLRDPKRNYMYFEKIYCFEIRFGSTIKEDIAKLA